MLIVLKQYHLRKEKKYNLVVCPTQTLVVCLGMGDLSATCIQVTKGWKSLDLNPSGNWSFLAPTYFPELELELSYSNFFQSWSTPATFHSEILYLRKYEYWYCNKRPINKINLSHSFCSNWEQIFGFIDYILPLILHPLPTLLLEGFLYFPP